MLLKSIDKKTVDQTASIAMKRKMAKQSPFTVSHRTIHTANDNKEV